MLLDQALPDRLGLRALALFGLRQSQPELLACRQGFGQVGGWNGAEPVRRCLPLPFEQGLPGQVPLQLPAGRGCGPALQHGLGILTLLQAHLCGRHICRAVANGLGDGGQQGRIRLEGGAELGGRLEGQSLRLASSGGFRPLGELQQQRLPLGALASVAMEQGCADRQHRGGLWRGPLQTLESSGAIAACRQGSGEDVAVGG